MKSRKKDVEKNRRISLTVYMTIVMAACLYGGLHLGVVYQSMEQPTLFSALMDFGSHMAEHPFTLFPSDWLMVGLFFFVGVMVNLAMYNEYLRVSESVNDAHGDAAFETDRKQYNLEFVLNPKKAAQVTGREITDKYAPYNEEHKRVLSSYPSKKVVKACSASMWIFRSLTT